MGSVQRLAWRALTRPRGRALARGALLLALLAAGCGGAAAPSATSSSVSAVPSSAPATSSAAASSASASSATSAAATSASSQTAGSGEPIKIGIVTGTSGVYAALGQSQVQGGEIAAAEIGTLLGRPVQVVARDDKLNPQEAAKQAQELVTNQKVTILSGCVSAATTIGVNEVAKRANMIYLGTCQTAQLNTKKVGGPYTFHFTYSPYQQTKMVDGWIADNLGKKWYAIQADYAWGYENMEGLQAFIKTGGKGAELLGSTKTPLGTSDFSSFIPAIRAAKPDVVQIFVAGGDFIAFIRQAHQYGLHKEMKLWSPVVDAVFDEQAGYENIEGTYGGAIFDWQMEATNPLAKQLVDASVAKYKRPISSYGAIQYVAIKQWAEAVKKANSLDPDKVAAALNGTEFDTPWGKSHLRACDHQIVAPLQVTVGMSQQDAQALGGQFANLRFRKILTTIPASDDSLPSCQELGF